MWRAALLWMSWGCTAAGAVAADPTSIETLWIKGMWPVIAFARGGCWALRWN